MLTSSEAAVELGVSRTRVIALITAGRLKAVKFGPVWMIDPADLEAVRTRTPGRPRVTSRARSDKRRKPRS